MRRQVLVPDRLVDEHDVGVAAVALLGTTESPHADDRQPNFDGRATLGLDLLNRRLQRGLERHRGDIRERVSDLLEVRKPEEVGARDTYELTSSQSSCGRNGVLPVVIASYSGKNLSGEWTARSRSQLFVSAEHRDRLGSAREQVRDVSARGEQPRESFRSCALVAKNAQIPRRAAKRVAHLTKRKKPRIRVSGIGEPSEHHRQQRALNRRAPADTTRQRLEMPQCGSRINEAQCF